MVAQGVAENLEAMTAQQIRDIMKAKAWIIQSEPETRESHLAVDFLEGLRDEYADRVGLPHYLSQMLTDVYATRPASQFRLHWSGGREMTPEEETEVQVYLRRFKRDLPYKVVLLTLAGPIERYM
jgi:hypothetical protein